MGKLEVAICDLKLLISAIYDQAWFAVLGKILGACRFIGGVGTLIVRAGVLGI